MSGFLLLIGYDNIWNMKSRESYIIISLMKKYFILNYCITRLEICPTYVRVNVYYSAEVILTSKIVCRIKIILALQILD